jgi:hypothetical protein
VGAGLAIIGRGFVLIMVMRIFILQHLPLRGGFRLVGRLGHVYYSRDELANQPAIITLAIQRS